MAERLDDENSDHHSTLAPQGEEEPKDNNGDTAMPTLRIAVGSSNPAKIAAVRQAFATIFPQCTLELTSHEVDSGVRAQPWGDDETKLGARNRARAAFKEAKQNGGRPDFAVGLEGGIVSQEDTTNSSKTLWCMAWMCILGSNSARCTMAMAADAATSFMPLDKEEDLEFHWGEARTSTFCLPPAVSKLVLDRGMELGHANDVVFGRSDSKHGWGAVGTVTNGLLKRAEYYEQALHVALVPWVRPDLYLL